MKIVLVGPPFAGKTTLLKKIQSEGIKVFHADSFVNEIYKPGEIGYKLIEENFGSEFVNANGVDKQKLSRLVSDDSEMMNKLNVTIHPLIKERLDGKDDYVAELPIITTSPIKFDYDKLILVTADAETIAERMNENIDQINKEFIIEMINKWNSNIEYDLVVNTSKEYEVKNILKEIKWDN